MVKKYTLFLLSFAIAILGSAESVPRLGAESDSPPPPVEVQRDPSEVPDPSPVMLLLEEDDQHSIGEPTDEEQLFVELINRARADAAAEAQLLANTDDPKVLSAIDQFDVDLNEMVNQFGELEASLPPLVINEALTDVARLHSLDMFEQVFQGHVSSSDPPEPFDPNATLGERVNAYGGYQWVGLNENVFSHARSVFHGHAGFQIDWGPGTWHGMQDPPGHREAIHHPDRRDIGVGVVKGSNESNGDSVGPILVTQVFGTEMGAEPMITGVVYYDLEENNFYSLGEGLGGVTVTSDAGAAWAETSGSGGYAFPVPMDGTYELTFEFGDFEPVTRTVTIQNGENHKEDLVLAYEAPALTGPESLGVSVDGIYTMDPIFGATDYRITVYHTSGDAWVEGAEDGDANITIEQSGGYSMIQDELSASGDYAFHFVHPEAFIDEILYLDRFLLVEESSEIKFDSRLGWATENQIARVEVSQDGNQWDEVYRQDGSGDSGESDFSARSVQLDDHAGQAIWIRFRYEHTSGSLFTQTGIEAGWVVDNITVTDSLQLEELTDASTGGVPEVELEFEESGDYVVRARPVNGSREFPPGEFLQVTAGTPSEPPIQLPDQEIAGGDQVILSLADFAEIDWRARITTNVGSFDIELRNDVAPQTVSNFVAYAAAGDYDSTFIHRSVPDFVIQGGGYTLTGQGEDFTVGQVPSRGTIPSEADLSNVRGTIAMALVGGDPDSGTNQWFINIDNNTFLDDPENGPFTVFGEITGSGMDVVDGINELIRVNFGDDGPFTEVPLLDFDEEDPSVTFEDFVTIPEVSLVDAPQVVANSRPDLVEVDLNGDQLQLQAVEGVSGESEVTLGFYTEGVWKEASFNVTINLVETIPGFGQVEVLPQDNRYRSAYFGELEFADDGADQTSAFSHSLQSQLNVQDGAIHSPLYGTLTRNEWGIDDWVVSEFFGLVHFGRDAAQYDGWVNSERFDWMKFEDGGGGQRYLWVHYLQTWLAVNPDGSFHSFDFGWMTPQTGSLTRYNTRIGMVTADPANPQGWLASDRFGFVWFARDGTGVWFWSTTRNEWIGITEGGGLWSTAEGRFLE